MGYIQLPGHPPSPSGWRFAIEAKLPCGVLIVEDRQVAREHPCGFAMAFPSVQQTARMWSDGFDPPVLIGTELIPLLSRRTSLGTAAA